MSLVRLWRLPLVLLLSVGLVLPGCAVGEGDDPSDPCRPERQVLRGTGDNFAKDILAGAAIGAIGGAVIGGILGGGRGALAGALAGGAVGAASGYLHAKQQQYQNDAALYNSVFQDISTENANIDKTQLAFDHLTACRNTMARGIRTDFRAGRISRDQANAAMGRVRVLAESDIRLAREINDHIQSRGNDFSSAVRELPAGGYATSSAYAGQGGSSGGYGRRPVARPAPSGNAEVRQVQAASSTNTNKRDQFQQSIARAQANTSSFELAS